MSGPLTAMTTRERWLAGLPARDAEELAGYREYAAARLVESARRRAILARSNTLEKDAALDDLYLAVVGPPPAGSVPLPRRAA